MLVFLHLLGCHELTLYPECSAREPDGQLAEHRDHGNQPWQIRTEGCKATELLIQIFQNVSSPLPQINNSTNEPGSEHTGLFFSHFDMNLLSL